MIKSPDEKSFVHCEIHVAIFIQNVKKSDKLKGHTKVESDKLGGHFISDPLDNL